jgi:DnaJ-class molecular chaperone
MPNDDDEAPPVCGTCLGAQGEWIELNGKKDKQRTWVPCSACQGTGRA